MSELIVTERENIVAIANAVRNKTGTTETMSLGGIVDSINGIETGGVTNTLYIGTTVPTDDVGSDGDIYIVREATA